MVLRDRSHPEVQKPLVQRSWNPLIYSFDWGEILGIGTRGRTQPVRASGKGLVRLEVSFPSGYRSGETTYRGIIPVMEGPSGSLYVVG